MYNTKLYEIQTNRYLKLYESLVGKKIIKESVASGLTAIENLKSSGKLKPSIISALENLPLNSADDLVKAIENILPSFRKDSIARKMLESNYISIEDKGKYLELLFDETKVIEAKKFAKEKLAASPAAPAAPQPQTPSVADPALPSSFSTKIKNYFTEVNEMIENLGVISPTDPKLKQMFDSIAESVKLKQIKNAEQLTDSILLHVLGEERYGQLTTNARKIKQKITPEDIMKFLTPEEKRLVASMNDYLIEVANQNKIKLERTTSIVRSLITDTKYEIKKAGLKSAYRVSQNTLTLLGKIIHTIVFRWAIPLKPTSWGIIPWFYSIATKGKLMSPWSNITANILVGLIEPAIFEYIKEITIQAKSFASSEELDSAIKNSSGEEKEKIVQSKSFLLENVAQLEVVSWFWWSSGFGARFVGKGITSSGISSWLINKVTGKEKAEVLSADETKKLEQRKGEEKRISLSLLDIKKRKIPFLRFKAIKNGNQQALEAIKNLEENLLKSFEGKEVDKKQLSSIESEIKEIEDMLNSSISATTSQPNLPSVSNIPRITKQPSPPSPSSGAAGVQ